jgi:PAS domain S-box-containing protein
VTTLRDTRFGRAPDPADASEAVAAPSNGHGLSGYLARRRDEQAALYRFTDRLYRAKSASDIYEGAFEAIAAALGCERASILLFDGSGAMRFVAWRGLSEGYRRAVEGHSPWTRDTKDPQPICIADIARADISDALKDTVKAEGIGALAFIPVVANGELAGKFMTYYGRPHLFSDTEVELAVTIARQLGFSIERMRSEEAHRRAERELSDFFDNASVGLHWVGPDGIIIKANRHELEMLGYEPDQYIGRHIADFHVSKDVCADILQRLSAGEVLENCEAQLRCKDGTIRDVLISSSVLWDDGRFVHTRCFTTDITERKQAQARQELLTREINHRTKNLFAVVHSVVARSFADRQTVADAKEAVLSRLHSLARAYSMLMEKDWQGADLRAVVDAALSPYGGRISVEGPAITLNANAAQNFSLALHELATNAAKYGALSNGVGRVHVGWSLFGANGSGIFKFRWQELGGPPVVAPKHTGFGSVVLNQVMAEYFDAPPHVEFAPGGVIYEVSGSLDALVAEPGTGLGSGRGNLPAGA